MAIRGLLLGHPWPFAPPSMAFHAPVHVLSRSRLWSFANGTGVRRLLKTSGNRLFRKKHWPSSFGRRRGAPCRHCFRRRYRLYYSYYYYVKTCLDYQPVASLLPRQCAGSARAVPRQSLRSGFDYRGQCGGTAQAHRGHCRRSNPNHFRMARKPQATVRFRG